MTDNPHDPNDLLTPGEVAEILRVQVSTLQEWRRLKKGPPYTRLGHRTVRYRRAVIDAWLEQRQDG
jgi:excisionase family DNA binding protein